MASIERRLFIGTLLAALPAVALADREPADSVQGGVKVAVGEDRFGKVRSIGLSSTTFKVATADTQGALFMMEHRNTKPGGPPLHLHNDQDEFWYILSGEYLFQIGSDRYRARAGDS